MQIHDSFWLLQVQWRHHHEPSLFFFSFRELTAAVHGIISHQTVAVDSFSLRLIPLSPLAANRGKGNQGDIAIWYTSYKNGVFFAGGFSTSINKLSVGNYPPQRKRVSPTENNRTVWFCLYNFVLVEILWKVKESVFFFILIVWNSMPPQEKYQESHKEEESKRNMELKNSKNGSVGFTNEGFVSEVKEKKTMVEDVNDSFDFDDLLPHIGEFGLYQRLLFLMMIPFAFFVSWVYFTQIFITLTPERYWCKVPELEHLTQDER